MHIDNEGDIIVDGSTSLGSMDDLDDIRVARDMERLLSPGTQVRYNFERGLSMNFKQLRDLKIVSGKSREDMMWCVTQHLRLVTNGGAQLRAMFEEMKLLADEMLPGFAVELNRRLEVQQLPAMPV
tara:strand:- start:611 stop:988 length:378 start_codon:yes stop_codon:yes gene_type:complete